MPLKSDRIKLIGWREWVGLPVFGENSIKAKIDTGALTSSLHAYDIEIDSAKNLVQFKFHPVQKKSKIVVVAEAPLLGIREIRSSNGHLSKRPVIETTVELHRERWSIELTLANRDSMGFRMLLGRRAIRGRFLVDAGESYCDKSRIPKKKRK